MAMNLPAARVICTRGGFLGLENFDIRPHENDSRRNVHYSEWLTL
jgi:hypothetical protein